jgi:uroporphyrinogen III methyltransferase/synthase
MIGTVYLVGAGPGDPGLITERGIGLLRTADAVVYDRLVAPELLAEIRPDAEVHYVGRARGSQTASQEEVNQLLVRLARNGANVVRLKGGDPFVFGRGGEEAEACATAGVPYEVVPGVTSAIGVPAYAGIPLTHRDVASSFAVITGHEDPSRPETRIDWPRLATAVDTLVILMGVEQFPRIVEQLLAHGRAPQTPVALISQGTRAEQRTLVGTLADIADRVGRAQLQAPAVAVVGEVVRLRGRLAWYDRRPLSGRRVLVARSRGQPSALTARLQNLGACVVEAPAFRIEPVCDQRLTTALDRIASYDWLLFTSAAAVQAFWTALAARGADARALAGTGVAAAGPGTAEAVAGRGVRPDFATSAYVARDVASALVGHVAAGQRLLLARGEDTSPSLGQHLARDVAVDDVVVYRLVQTDAAASRQAILAEPIDAVVLPSSGSVRILASLLGNGLAHIERAAILCMGPSTARAAARIGLRVAALPDKASIDGLVTAVVRAVGVSPEAASPE